MTNLFSSPKTWFALSAITLLLMGGVYIYQVNDLVKSVYLRDKNQERLVSLQEEIKRSEVIVSQNKSLTQIDELVKEEGFETVNQVDYVKVSDTQVAAIQ